MRRSRASFAHGSHFDPAIVPVSLLIFPIAAMCVEVTGLTHDGWPSIVELVGALPRMLSEAVRITFVNLLYCGLITVPAAALIGLVLAACGRMMVRMVERVSGAPAAERDAGSLSTSRE